MARAVSACRRVIVFDTVCQYTGQLAGFQRIGQPGELVEALRAAGDAAPFQIHYMPEFGVIEHFAHVCRLAGARERLVLAVDEVDYFCTAGAAESQFDWLVRYGRHRRVAMVYTARRPAEVYRNLTAQTTAFNVFRLTEPRDEDYMRRYIGPGADQLRRLGQFQYLRHSDQEPDAILGGRGN